MNTVKHEVRTVHLVDLENLTGDPGADRATALGVFERYLELARWRPGDLVYVATNPWLYKRIAWEPPVPWHLEFGHGEDGADRKLLAQAAPEWVACRFDRMVVGSGDGIFAPRAKTIRTRGLQVVVIGTPAGLSRSLAAAASSVVGLTEAPAPAHEVDLRDHTTSATGGSGPQAAMISPTATTT